MRTLLELGGRAIGVAAHPQRSIEVAREALEGVGEVAWAGLNPAPGTPLNVLIGPHRRFVFVRNELS